MRKTFSRLLILAVLVAVFGTMASPAWAAEFVVDRKDDPDPTTADDCTPGTDDDCSLRGAVTAANDNPGEDTITIPEGTYTLTISGSGENEAATGDLDITDDVIITGAGARSTTVTGGPQFFDRVFDVPPEVEATSDVAEVPSDVVAEISGLTITGGSGTDFGGGVRNAGELLTLEEVTVSENGSNFDGGGIRNDGVLKVLRSTVSDNTTGVFGGGISNDGEADVAAPKGFDTEGPGDLEIINSTVSGNEANVDFIPASARGVTPSGEIQADGGGIGNFNGGNLSLINVTLNDNSAERGGNLSNDSATTTFKNTIVSHSQGGGENCANTNEVGTIDSLGNNLDDDGSCDFDQPSDIVGENPRLGPLQNNGGPTDTHALKARSPAIDEGDDSACPKRDQRGVKRQDGDGNGTVICDIGAFEFEQLNTAPVAVNDRYVISFGRSISSLSPGILINDRDPEGDRLVVSRLVERPEHGKLELDKNSGSFVYTADRGFVGTDFFTYRASDGTTESNTASVRVIVRG